MRISNATRNDQQSLAARTTIAILSAQNSEANDCGMHYRWLSLSDLSPNLAHDFAFLCSLHESHLLRVVQSYGPGMLQAGHGGDRSVVIPFVSTSEWPTPVHAIYRAGTRSTIAKYS